MIISPSVAPVALIDQNSTNQTQNSQIQNSEQSRKATDTVQVSAQARELAGTEQNNKPVASTSPAAIQKAADNEVAEKVADNEVIEQQRPSNPITHKPETTKIDVLA